MKRINTLLEQLIANQTRKRPWNVPDDPIQQDLANRAPDLMARAPDPPPQVQESPIPPAEQAMTVPGLSF